LMELNLLCSLIKPEVLQTVRHNHRHSQTTKALNSAFVVCELEARHQGRAHPNLYLLNARQHPALVTGDRFHHVPDFVEAFVRLTTVVSNDACEAHTH
jgi:hypothetical protein